MSESGPGKKKTPEQVEEALAFVDGALGAAGHTIDDPESRELLRKQAAGEITADEAVASTSGSRAWTDDGSAEASTPRTALRRGEGGPHPRHGSPSGRLG